MDAWRRRHPALRLGTARTQAPPPQHCVLTFLVNMTVALASPLRCVALRDGWEGASGDGGGAGRGRGRAAMGWGAQGITKEHALIIPLLRGVPRPA